MGREVELGGGLRLEEELSNGGLRRVLSRARVVYPELQPYPEAVNTQASRKAPIDSGGRWSTGR
jgi:hypothetical protein